MSKKKIIFSSKEITKILIKRFEFEMVKQKGSHIKLQKVENGRKITTIVPNHKEVARGTLLGILELAEIEKDDFLKRASKK